MISRSGVLASLPTWISRTHSWSNISSSHLLCLWSGSNAGDPSLRSDESMTLFKPSLTSSGSRVRVSPPIASISSFPLLCLFHVCVSRGPRRAGAPSCSAPLRAPSRSSWTGPGRPGRSGRAPGRRSAAPRRSRLWSDGSSVAAGCRSSSGGLLESLTSWCCHHDESIHVIVIGKCLLCVIFLNKCVVICDN